MFVDGFLEGKEQQWKKIIKYTLKFTSFPLPSFPSVNPSSKLDLSQSVLAGSVIETGDLVYVPPRDGPTLWEIGFPNRSASEFYVPDPNPMYINKLYVNHPDRFALNNKTF